MNVYLQNVFDGDASYYYSEASIIVDTVVLVAVAFVLSLWLGWVGICIEQEIHPGVIARVLASATSV